MATVFTDQLVGRAELVEGLASPDLIDPVILQDSKHPAVQSRTGPPAVQAIQGAFDGAMDQVIDILRVSTERGGKASQSWQQGYDLVRKTGMIRHSSVS
jgi:hypothetical protein